MENLHNGKSKFYTHQWIKYLLEFTTVSEDSDILSHKNGSLLFLLCLYEISKILMVRAHIDIVNLRPLIFKRREVEITNILVNYQEKQCV